MPHNSESFVWRIVSRFFCYPGRLRERLSSITTGKCRPYNPLLDSMLAAIDKGDFDLYVRNYDKGLKMLLTKERFSQMNGKLQNKLGKYKSRKYLGFMTKGKSNQFMWIGKLDQGDDDVLIRLVVSWKGGKDMVMGLYFQ